MGRAKTAKSSGPEKKIRPALSPEARESQLISLSVDLAEKQLREGTASSQVITHFLKLGTTMARLETEKLERENELLRAKTESLQSAQNREEMYDKVIKALQKYSGRDEDEYEY